MSGPSFQLIWTAVVLNDGSEMALSDGVRRAGGGPNTRDPSYTGQLIFILDACDSGNGIFETDLSVSELKTLPTILLTSSSANQKSRKLKNRNVSAFTS